MVALYHDRRDAGRQLAEALRPHLQRDENLLVLALPRGGVPVAYEVATAFEAPLDLILVRKLGVPGQPELAMGAVASGGTLVVNDAVIRQTGISSQIIEEQAEHQRAALARREQRYRGDRPIPSAAGRTVALVDDGFATGASMRAAVHALHKQGAARIIAAVPVAPADTAEHFAREVDVFICPHTPSPFYGVGRWYRHFEQTSDYEVRHLLECAWQQQATSVKGG